ncbi:preprotein translocase subunit SecY [Ruminococcaceae bacterium OttesenSCG-928-L11]|nr:preprotein translocase subunit SecY [Ruminococcaceae bacterium OttesenSCG-928-L11]
MLETIRNAWKVEDLRKKILFTLMIILVYRVGSAIPVPFLDTSMLSSIFQGGGFLDYLNLLSGGALQSGTLFALSISPYITSSIVIQLLTVAIPALEAMSKEGADGRKKLNKITRYTTVGLALLQSVAYYIMNRNYNSVAFTSGIEGAFAGLTIILTFTAGSMLVVWLGEQIDKKGVGNGISMILFAGIISRGPQSLKAMLQYWELARKGGQTQYYILVPLVLVMFLVVIAAIVVMTNAERRIPVQYAKRVVGRKMYGGQSSYIPIKVTMSGVLPVIFASSLLSIPSMIRSFIDPNRTRFLVEKINEAGETVMEMGWAGKIWGAFEYTHWFYAILYLVLIIAFNYFYVAIQYNPVEMANNLRKNNGAIPGIRPGKPTSDFISKVISKITLVGALFIALIAILPIIMGNVANMGNISLGGTSIIIVVGVALDTVRQLESQMMMRHYKGFLE